MRSQERLYSGKKEKSIRNHERCSRTAENHKEGKRGNREKQETVLSPVHGSL
jgi:hypothetical protein